MFIIMLFPLLGIGLFLVMPVPAALPLYVVGTGLAFLFHWAMMTSSRSRVTTGRRGMLGMNAEIVSWDGDSGEVRCHGEIWRARVAHVRTLRTGERVTVIACDGLTLTVDVPSLAGGTSGSRDRNQRTDFRKGVYS